MTVLEWVNKVEVCTEILICEQGGKCLGLIPAVKEKSGLYTRETKEWKENNLCYSPKGLSLKKLSKEDSESLLKRDAISIGGNSGGGINIYIK